MCSFSPFIIYLFSHLFTSRRGFHFILWAVIQYHCINFVPITAPALAAMSSFDWHPGPCDNITCFQLTSSGTTRCLLTLCTPPSRQSAMSHSFHHWNNIPPYNRHSLFAHLPIEGHLDCFQFLVIMNKVAIDTSVWLFVDNFLKQLKNTQKCYRFKQNYLGVQLRIEN